MADVNNDLLASLLKKMADRLDDRADALRRMAGRLEDGDVAQEFVGELWFVVQADREDRIRMCKAYGLSGDDAVPRIVLVGHG